MVDDPHSPPRRHHPDRTIRRGASEGSSLSGDGNCDANRDDLDREGGIMRGAWIAVAVAIAIGALGTSCSSSSKSASAGGTPTTFAPAPSVSPNASCPFSGSTTSQSEPGSSASTVLNSVTPTPAGCIDNVTFGFSKALAPSVTAYQSTTASPAVLVVTFKNATLGGGLKQGTTPSPKSVNYVSKVVLSSASGDVVFDITLDKVRPFLVSSTQVPPQLVIAIG
jgi:hypothetical protein